VWGAKPGSSSGAVWGRKDMTDRVQLTTTKINNLRRARKNLKFSQADVAKKAKVPRARIKRIENSELQTLDEGEYNRLLLALQIVTPRPRRSAKKPGNQLRAKLKRALEREGLLDVPLRELLG